MLSRLEESRIIIQVTLQSHISTNFVIICQEQKHSSKILLFRTRSCQLILYIFLSNRLEYLNQLRIIDHSLINPNIHNLQHTSIIITRPVLLKTIILRSFLIIFHRKIILPIFLIDFSYSFLYFCYI